MATLAPGEHARTVALGGIARGGATRGGYYGQVPYVVIDGTPFVPSGIGAAKQGFLMDTLTITDALNDVPDRATVDTVGLTFQPGQEIVFTIGTPRRSDREFAGQILTVEDLYDPAPHLPPRCRLSLIDYTFGLNQLKVNLHRTAATVATLAAAILADVEGYTLDVAAEVAETVLDEISMTEQDVTAALSQLAKRAGLAWLCDYDKVVRVFATQAYTADPAPVPNGQLQAATIARDDSQIITRVRSEGGGVGAITETPPGESRLAVADPAWYNAAGGRVKVQTQTLTYTGLQAGAGGSLVGPGTGPSAALTLAAAAGAGLGTGVYQYAYTDVTAAGESLPGPRATVQTNALMANPTITPACNYTNLGMGGPYPFAVGDGRRWWAYTFLTAAGETLPSPLFGPAVAYPLGGSLPYYLQSGLPIGPAGTTARKLYRTVQNGAQLYLAVTVGNNTATTVDDHVADGALGAAAPTVNTAATGLNQVALTGIALGPPGTTARNLYRTVLNGSALKWLYTVPDNTTTTIQDANADGLLGAAAPTADTSGLPIVPGTVIAGSTTLLLASAGAFAATGGWAVSGNGQRVLRYTGVSGNTLTGIPATGPGAITAAISYGSTITPAAALTGIPTTGAGAITEAIQAGAVVNVLAVEEDLIAQAALVARGYPHDGIREDSLQDQRLSETEARLRAKTWLQIRSTPIATFSGVSRDWAMRSGRTVTSTLAGSTETFLIQEVVSTEYGVTNPRRQVRASSVRETFESLLRLLHQGP